MLEEEEKESWADEERALCESLPLFQSFLGGLDVAKICQVVQQDFNKMVAFIYRVTTINVTRKGTVGRDE